MSYGLSINDHKLSTIILRIDEFDYYIQSTDDYW